MAFAKSNLAIVKADVIDVSARLEGVIQDFTFSDTFKQFQTLVARVEQRLNKIVTRVDLSRVDDFTDYAHALNDEILTLNELCDVGYMVRCRSKFA